MPLLAIPNVSESDRSAVASLRRTIEAKQTRVLDIHTDDEHRRTVFTCTGEARSLVEAMTSLAVEAASVIDLRQHTGAHPRVGALDVCPFVAHDAPMAEAVGSARETARSIGGRGIPVLLYGDASPTSRPLPEIRRGGLPGLVQRVAEGLRPDHGPEEIDPAVGIVCVGARDVLIAFNVWIDGDVRTAQDIARRIRESNGGLSGVRALGLDVTAHGRSQISINLVDPKRVGIDPVFTHLEDVAADYGARAVATEIVGLVPERFFPAPDAKATRLLIEPGRSLESALRG